MRVFVTGGTGAIGGHTIPVLVQQGHTVPAVRVSLFNRSALAAAFTGHDAVANLEGWMATAAALKERAAS